MIAGHAGIDFPNQIIARDHSTDRFIHFGDARGGPIFQCHSVMLEPLSIHVNGKLGHPLFYVLFQYRS